jgi:hypothetical protein
MQGKTSMLHKNIIEQETQQQPDDEAEWGIIQQSRRGGKTN